VDQPETGRDHSPHAIEAIESATRLQPLHYPLQEDENVRGVNFYTPVGGRG